MTRSSKTLAHQSVTRRVSRPAAAGRQHGMALIVGLIMLVLITLATVASFNIGRTSLDIVSNMQHRSEAVTAANNAIQEALSTTRLFNDSANILANPCTETSCGGLANCRCVDTNGDGTMDVTVRLTPQPTCVQARNILNAELQNDLESADAAVAMDANNCLLGTTQGVFGIVGVPTGASSCAQSVWEIVAVAADAVTQAAVTVTQGAGVRVSSTAVATACP